MRILLVLMVLLAPLATFAADSTAVTRQINELQNSDWQVRRNAAHELGELRSEHRTSVEALTAALGDDDSRVRRASADALGKIGPKASRSIPALVDLFDDVDPAVIAAAAQAVGSMESRASRAREDLTKLLDHSDARVRRAAAESIGQLGRRASRSMGELGEQLRDDDAGVRAAAARSLGQMGSKASGYSSQLVRILDDEDAAVVEAASAALVLIGDDTVSVLIRALENGDPVFLQAVVDTLGRHGSTAVPELVDALGNTNKPSLPRRYAAMALARIGAADKRVVVALYKTLDDERADVRMSCAEALGNIGPAAEGALLKLIDVASNQREEVVVRQYAIAAIARIAPTNELVNEVLVSLVSDGDPGIYESAIEALVAVRALSVSDSDLRQLIGQVEDGHADAARRLGDLGPYAADAVPALTQALAEPGNDIELRSSAAEALGKIGADAEAAVPELIRALDDDNRQLRDAALVSLGRIGPQTQTIPALLQAMRSGDLATRGAAAAKLETFARARIETWRPLLLQADAPVMRNWLARHEALYGIEQGSPLTATVDSRGRSTDYFDLLGGRAAIRESVQLDLIGDPVTGASERRNIPLSNLQPVRVESHDFKELLKNSEQAVPSMPLASLVPQDRFFAWFRSVAALRDVFAGGSDQFLRFESALAVKSVEYDLEQQYMRRLGLDSGMLDQLQALGGVDDLAIIAPDLFFVDGTDLTAVVNLTSPNLTHAVLQLLGLGDAGNERATYTLPNGSNVYWAIRDGVLIISTSDDELTRVLELHERGGRDSLGQSDEFRYMQQQLGIASTTEAYFYFSDPFVRRLVSPGVKIAQLRRMQARAEMEMLAAGAMLYLLDGDRVVPSKRQLITSAYVPRYFEDRDYTISEDLIVRSASYGTIARPKSLSANPVGNVSQREADAYKTFVGNYSRYWRQFFDPIAMRLDRIDDETLEINTFILPLLDSNLYNQVQDALTTRESGRAFTIPVMNPTPSMVFSLNVSDDLRVSLSRQLAGMLVQYTSVDPEIFDSIGSGVHLAVQDSTPIVALGSGDVWGALDRDMLRMEGFESFLPFLLSLVTQPSTVLIELAEPDKVQAFLNDAVVRRAEGGAEGEFHRVQNQEAWIYSLNMEDLFQVHLRVEIKQGYLLISNLPWSTQLDIEDFVEAELNGAQLQLNLDEISQQLPALHTKVFADYRAAAVDGMGYLYPFLATGLADTVADATAKHFDVFGFRPVHPNRGEWLWRDSYLESNEFGTALRPVQPEHQSGEKDFGLFPTVGRIAVNMQLEQSGMRARVRWRTNSAYNAEDEQQK